VGGPTIEWFDGSKTWCLHNKIYRQDFSKETALPEKPFATKKIADRSP
jgi:hypothetical protein